MRTRHKVTAPEVAVTPVYRLESVDGDLWRVVDALEIQSVGVVSGDGLMTALTRLARSSGRAIDVGTDGYWVRVHADGTTAPVGRPWSIERYEQMRHRDRQDLALIAALGDRWQAVTATVGRIRGRRRLRITSDRNKQPAQPA